jgi:diaminopimelate epimerase
MLEGLPFSKLAGGGNDFVMIDHREARLENPSALTRAICTRRLSVGGDGLVLLEHSDVASFRMRYINADGSETEFCGNGTRCAARFAREIGLADEEMTIETGAGVVRARIEPTGEVVLELDPPSQWQPHRSLRTAAEGSVEGSYLMVGVPHYVLFREGAGFWTDPIEKPGAEIRRHPDLGTAGANVNFARIDGPGNMSVRTWERGVEGETLSCGSGVTASVAAAALLGMVESPVSVRTRSGVTLTVSFERHGEALGRMQLRGDARIVFSARITPETVTGFDPDWVREPRD